MLADLKLSETFERMMVVNAEQIKKKSPGLERQEVSSCSAQAYCFHVIGCGNRLSGCCFVNKVNKTKEDVNCLYSFIQKEL